MATATPPLAVPSSFVSTMPLTPATVMNSRACASAVLPDRRVEHEEHLVRGALHLARGNPPDLVQLGHDPVGDLHEPTVKVAMDPGRHLAKPLMAARQELRRCSHVARGDHPHHQRALTRLADLPLLLDRQPRPPARAADPQQERSRRGGHLVLGEMTGRDEIVAVGADQRLDLGVASEAGHLCRLSLGRGRVDLRLDRFRRPQILAHEPVVRQVQIDPG